MTSLSTTTPVVDPEPEPALESSRARGVQPTFEGQLHVMSPDLWSLCAPGASLPGCQERERLAMPLLLRAIQASDPDVRFVSDLKARHITSAYQVLVRLAPSKDLMAAIRNAAGALVENVIGHEQSPYPGGAA